MNRFAATPFPDAPHGPDLIQMALALRAQGRSQEALEALSAARETAADFYVLLGDLQFELGRLQDAAESYAKVTRESPGNTDAQAQLGLCYHGLEQWEAAAQAFHAVLEADPNRDEVRLQLGDCLLRLQTYDAALCCFERCWSDASLQRVLFGKAVALQMLRRFDEAVAHYERLLSIDPAAAEALSNLIALSMEISELSRVEHYSQRLLELDPGSVVALQGLAVAAIERWDYPASVPYFRQVCELQSAGTLPFAGSVGTLEYRISRKVLENLEAAGSKLSFKTARAASGTFSR